MDEQSSEKNHMETILRELWSDCFISAEDEITLADKKLIDAIIELPGAEIWETYCSSKRRRAVELAGEKFKARLRAAFGIKKQ